MFVNALAEDPRRVIEHEYFHGLKRPKGFARAVTSLGIEEAVQGPMKENAKREMLDSVPPLLRATWAVRAKGAGLAGMAGGIRRKIMLSQICFRKVAQ